jgi:hypothetical protein
MAHSQENNSSARSILERLEKVNNTYIMDEKEIQRLERELKLASQRLDESLKIIAHHEETIKLLEELHGIEKANLEKDFEIALLNEKLRLQDEFRKMLTEEREKLQQQYQRDMEKISDDLKEKEKETRENLNKVDLSEESNKSDQSAEQEEFEIEEISSIEQQSEEEDVLFEKEDYISDKENIQSDQEKVENSSVNVLNVEEFKDPQTQFFEYSMHEWNDSSVKVLTPKIMKKTFRRSISNQDSDEEEFI